MIQKVVALAVLCGASFGLFASPAGNAQSRIDGLFKDMARMSAEMLQMNNFLDSYVRNPITDRTSLAYVLNYKVDRLRSMQQALDALEANRGAMSAAQQAELDRMQQAFRTVVVYHGHASVMAVELALPIARGKLEKKAASIREQLREIRDAVRQARFAV